MAPIRRYLRITRYSVLEVRIYLDNPALGASWLLNARNPVLPRVIEAVRPLVLPKLKEENARERGKTRGSKKKGVKDVVVEDDFEVSIFLTETSTRHTLLTKQKHFHEKGDEGMTSNSSKLTGAGLTSEEAIDVEDRGRDLGVPFLRRENSDEDAIDLKDIPLAEEDNDDEEMSETIQRKPKRARLHIESEDDSADGLFVDADEDEDEEPSPKRMKDTTTLGRDGQEDKKKMAMDTSYDGFSIYGRVLCLVVKRRDMGKAKGGVTGGQAMMEEWITSTQMPPLDDDGL